MEALWMGVPVLTLAGKRFLARQGLGILSEAGLADWVANNEDDLVAKAVAKASTLEELAELRASMRRRLKQGSLLDAAAFARKFLDALLGMWSARDANDASSL